MDRLKSLLCILLVSGLILVGCTPRTALKSDELFIGKWELVGRSMLDGIQIQIEREDAKLVGRVIKRNDNKYVQLFLDSNAVLVSGITRSSDFQFKLTENKVAKELFSTYDLSGSQEFNVEFIDSKTIGLAKGNLNPQKSAIVYKKL